MFNKNKQKQRQNITFYILDDAFTVKHSIYNVLEDRSVTRNMDATFYAIGEGILFEELRDTLDKNKADLYFLDTELEDGSGWDLVPLIKEKYPEAHIIMLSDGLNPKLKAKREQYEPSIFSIIEKPFQPGIVIGALNELVAFINSSSQLSKPSRKHEKHGQLAVNHLTSNTFAPAIMKEKSKPKERKLSGLSIATKQLLEEASSETQSLIETTVTNKSMSDNDFDLMSHLFEDPVAEDEVETKHSNAVEFSSIESTSEPLFNFSSEPTFETEKMLFDFTQEPTTVKSHKASLLQKESTSFEESVGKRIDLSGKSKTTEINQIENSLTHSENHHFNTILEEKNIINDEKEVLFDVFTLKNNKKTSTFDVKNIAIDDKYIINDEEVMEKANNNIKKDVFTMENALSTIINDGEEVEKDLKNVINDVEMMENTPENCEKTPKNLEKAISLALDGVDTEKSSLSQENDDNNVLDFLFLKNEDEKEGEKILNDDLDFSFDFSKETTDSETKEVNEEAFCFDFDFGNKDGVVPKEKDNSFDFNFDEIENGQSLVEEKSETNSDEAFDFDFNKNDEVDFFNQPLSPSLTRHTKDKQTLEQSPHDESSELNERHSEVNELFDFSIKDDSSYEKENKEEKNQSVTPENFDLEFVLSENKSEETLSMQTDNDLLQLFEIDDTPSSEPVEGLSLNFEYLKQEDSYSEEPNIQPPHQSEWGVSDDEEIFSFLFDDTSSFEMEETDEEIEDDEDDEEEEFFIRPPMSKRW